MTTEPEPYDEAQGLTGAISPPEAPPEHAPFRASDDCLMIRCTCGRIVVGVTPEEAVATFNLHVQRRD